MNDFSEDHTRITQGACRALAEYRRRLRAHELMPEDEVMLAEVLDWVEECLVITPGEVG